MRAGLVPLCYHLGGPRGIVEHTVSGYLYRDLDELQTYTLALASRPELLRRMSTAAVERAARFTRVHFDEALSSFLRSVVLA